jgi:hypothetical protein
MTGFQGRSSRRGQAISLSLALREGMDKKEGGKSLYVGGKTMDFDFCQLLYTAIDEIYSFRFGFERAHIHTKEF